MVLINLKSSLPGGPSSANDSFLYETTSSTKIDDLIESLVEIHNARLRCCLIIDAVRGLAMYGVMKKPAEAGTDEVQEIIGNTVEKGPNYTADPSGLRTGNPPDGNMVEVLQQEALSLEDYVSKEQVQRKIPLTIQEINKKINNVRGAVTMAYPMGLPEWDLTRIALDEPIEKLKNTYLGGFFVQAENAALWSCNKEFRRGQRVSDRLGSCNEKTKVITKLTTKGSGPPAREPIVSEAERNAMTAFYFKRQEELKKLAEADEDDYLNSEWADPKGMKRNLQGLGDVKAPGLRF
ncbi:hypothetical protein HJC23_012035 [Cyclotella cryptica]|uniref:Uncharacterized protein n=1 Tax=Cyclotella cryptica TaxID=29204 RepID=A0ABD3PQT3_9STRA|eukprot:CCRYP_012338-RB/>CCRYP_012338-RB protein AED:0.23 eAED:0.23 QI:182/1/1/1/0.75/0.6/5/1542/292